MLSSRIHFIKTLPRLEKVNDAKVRITQRPLTFRRRRNGGAKPCEQKQQEKRARSESDAIIDRDGGFFLLGFPDARARDYVRNRIDIVNPDVSAVDNRPEDVTEKMRQLLEAERVPADIVSAVATPGMTVDTGCRIVFRKADDRVKERLLRSYSYHVDVLHAVDDFGRYEDSMDSDTFLHLFLTGACDGLAIPLRLTMEDEDALVFWGQMIYDSWSSTAADRSSRPFFSGPL